MPADESSSPSSDPTPASLESLLDFYLPPLPPEPEEPVDPTVVVDLTDDSSSPTDRSGTVWL